MAQTIFIYYEIMLFNFFLLSFFVCSLTVLEKAQAQGLSWAYSITTQDVQEKISHGVVAYSVSSEMTTIANEKEIIYVDYIRNILYRYDKQSEKCSGFPLSTSSSPQYSKENKALQLSSFRLFATDKSQKISRHTCRLKRILFGADFAKFQTVAPPTTDAFGQIFTESMVSYCVSSDVAGFNSILAIAKQHSGFFEGNQFLRQIDIVGLFEILYGFPVQIIKTANNIKTTLSLIDEPKLINNVIIPKQCQ